MGPITGRRLSALNRPWIVIIVALMLISAGANLITSWVSSGAATVQNAPNGSCGLCVLAPSGTSLVLSGNGGVNLTGSNVIVNSSSGAAVAVTGNGSLSSPSVGVVGGTVTSGKGTIQNLTTGISPVADPLRLLGFPNLPRPTTVPSVSVSGNTKLTINPGVYSSVTVSGNGVLTLNPGFYVVLSQVSASGNGQFKAVGASLYLGCSSYPTPCKAGQAGASASLTGNGLMMLTASALSCPPVAIFSDPNNTSTISISGNGNDTLSGAIYAKSGTLDLSGNGSSFQPKGQIVVGKATLTGNGNITIPTYLPPTTGMTLSLNGPTSPLDIGADAPLQATLDCQAMPIASEPVNFSVTGPNATTGSSETNSSGSATFSYAGTMAGTDTAQASFAFDGSTISSNTVTINWNQPFTSQIAAASTELAQGNFYAEPAGATSFVAQPGDTPAFTQEFPTIDFNPPSGTVNGEPATGPSPTTRPFTDVTTDLSGDYAGTTLAQGNGVQAGVGSLDTFDAVFTSDFAISKPGDVTFNVISADGFLLGIGGSASRVSGAYDNPPSSNTSPFDGYPLVGAENLPGSGPPGTFQVTVHFPAAGTYPYELDYFSSSDTQLSLTLGVASFSAQTSPLSVYVGYADGVRPAGSIFPFPWEGSPGVSFYGCITSPPASPSGDPCSYDSGALRFDNSSASPITLDSVTVDLGSNHFDLWPHPIVVPPSQTVILAMTDEYDFDASDFSGAPCGGNDGVIPQVNVTIAGKTTTYADSNQIINTHGYDLACQGNESESWQRIGGGGTAINTPLPPAMSLIMSPAHAGPDVVGQSQSFTVAAMDGSGNPVPNLPIAFNVFGGLTGAPDNQVQHMTTNASGLADFSYTGRAAETDTINATALNQGLEEASNTVALQWNIPVPGGAGSGGTPAQAPPVVSSVTPADGAQVTSPVPVEATITPPTGETISSWDVTYQGQNTGSSLVTLASGTGTPPSTLATFDPSLLTDGAYTITVSATASGGGVQTDATTVDVYGQLKLGRYVTTYHDLTVPVDGFDMSVDRIYDSTDKSIGDFGVGWHVSLSNFKVTTNRVLGAGGWNEYPTSCIVGLCNWSFKTSTPHFVTVTWPDGHQEVFNLTPSGGQALLYWQGSAGYTAVGHTGTTSTLVPMLADQGISYGFDGNIYGTSGVYSPTEFELKAHDGTTYVLSTISGLVSEIDPNGNSLAVDSTGVHASNGQSLTYTRDSLGRITHMTGPSGQVLNYAYSSAGDLSSSTDADGNATTYTYDADHDLLSAVGPGGKALETLKYDSSGRLVSVTDGDGNITTLTNNVSGQEQTIADPNGKLTTIDTFDALGDLIEQDQVFNSTVLATKHTYDVAGNQTSETDPLGNTTTTTYDANGDPTSLSDPLGHQTTFTYNTFGDPLTVTNPGGQTVATATYDANGNMTGLSFSNGTSIQVSYNSAGQPTSITDQLGHTTTLAYDASGHVNKEVDPGSGTIFITTNASGQTVSETDATGNATMYAYDGNGNLTSMTDPLGNTTTYIYNAQNKLASMTDPLHHTTTYSYDPTGLLTSSTNRDGVTTNYTYNLDGQPLTESLSTGEFTDFAYDPLGRPTTITNENAQVAYQYNAANEATSETDSAAGASGLPTVSLTRTYDADGRPTSVIRPDGTVGYSYNALGELSSITVPGSTAFGITYNGQYKPTSITQPNGLTGQFTYDSANELTGLSLMQGATTEDAMTYAYNVLGLRSSAQQTPAPGTTTYGYDASGQLTQAAYPGGEPSDSFTYDANGNRITSNNTPSGPLAYNAGNELTTDGTYNYQYDNQGQLVSKRSIATGQTTKFQWNGQGQLTMVTYPNGTTSTYIYDPLGRRVEVNDNGQVTKYGYDGANIGLEYDKANSLQATYVFAPGDNYPLEMTRGGQQYEYLVDGNGNVLGLTNAGGSLVDSYQYNAFGQPTAQTGTVTNPFTFAGLQFDSGSGLYYDEARYYDPTDGRFISQDPIEKTNPYPYVDSSPPNYTDPSGALLAEYAPLLSQQLSMGEALSKVNRCIGLALLYGLDTGDSAGAVQLVRDGFSAYQSIVPYSDFIFGGADTKGAAEDVYSVTDSGISTYQQFAPESPGKFVELQPTGLGDLSPSDLYNGGEKVWSGDGGGVTPIGGYILEGDGEPLGLADSVSGTVGDSITLFDLIDSFKQLAGCGC